jgi:uncharacterized membrane protein
MKPAAERRARAPGFEVVAAAVRDNAGWLRHVPVGVLAVLYAARFASLGIAALHGYEQPAFDLGIPDQGIWLLSRFHDPFVTVMGRQLFGDHTTFVYVLLVPFYWIYPHTSVLLVVQAVLIAAGAVPVYLLARHLRLGTVAATLLAAAYLLNPALQQGNMEQFHVECFEVALIAAAIYFAVVWRPALLVASVVLLLLCKEDAAMYALPIGVWVAFRRDRRTGLALVAGSVVSALVDNLLVIPALIGVFNVHANRLPFGGFGGSLRTLVRHPGAVLSYLGSQGRPFYLWQLAASAGLVFVLAPEIAALAVVGVAVNLVSTFGYQHEIDYHYSLPIVPILACGTVWAVSRVRRAGWRRAAVAGVTVAALWACTVWGLAPFSDETYPIVSASSPLVVETNQVVRAVPPHAVVSAFYDYVPELDHRRRIYMWPNPFKASYWGDLREEGQRLPFASQVQYVVLPVSIVDTDPTWRQVSRHFRLVKGNAAADLFERAR